MYKHVIGGKGVAKGLPLRRASQLYDVEPDIRYPLVLSTGLDSDLHTYDRAIYLRVPHLPITFLVEPYISNHKAGGNFTRRQYFVIKRGQPLMASTKRDATIGLFATDGTITDKTYVDPAKLEKATLVGYTDGSADGWYRLNAAPDGVDDDSGPAAGALTIINKATYDALPATDAVNSTDETDQTDYTVIDMSANGYLTVAEFDGLAADSFSQEGFRGVYEGLENENDAIPTGGVDQFSVVEEAIFGTSDIVQFVEIDADVFYFNAATRSEGFIYPSTGGAPRTIFFNEVDQEAMVTLPSAADGTQRIVKAIGNVTDVSASNGANWANAAVALPVRPTIGFAHTDLEQTTSHQFHQFSTGTDVHTPVKKGRLTIPYVDIAKLKTIIEANTDQVWGTDFQFSDITGGRSGVKVGVFDLLDANDAATDIDYQNLWSFLSENDKGYANLYYNFAAPFLVSTRSLRLRDKVVPDLFGNYTLQGEVAIDDDTNDFGNLAVATEKTAAEAKQAEHVVGRVQNIYDMPSRALLHLEVNPIWQSRIVDSSQDRNFANEGYRRVRGADNAGMEPILSDFLFMLLGGSSYDWATQILPKWGGLPQDLAGVIERIVLEGAAGLVEIALNVVD